MNTPGDDYIVRQVLKGNQELFRVIVERYQNHIFTMGMRFFKNPDDAADFTQEVFVKVYNNLSSFKGMASFKSWLMKVGYNHAVNKFISNKNTQCDEYNDSQGNTPDPLNIVMKNELHDIIEKAINDLPEAYKVCIDLYFYVGLPFKEISHITGYPLNTIKSYVFRAKQHLYNALKGTIAEEYNEM